MTLAIIQTALCILAGVGMWKIWRALGTQDRLVRWVVFIGFASRAIAGTVLFWISYLQIPILSRLQMGNGHWFFATDGRRYLREAILVAEGGLPTIISHVRTGASVSYVQSLAIFTMLFGNAASVGVLLNLFSYLGMCLIIVKWRNAIPAARTPGLIALAAISLSPSAMLWSTQPLKDTLFQFLIVVLIGAGALWQRAWRDQPVPNAAAVAALGMIAALFMAAGIRWYFGFVALGGAALFLLLTALMAKVRLRAFAAGAIVFFLLAQALVLSANAYLPPYLQKLLMPWKESVATVESLSPDKLAQELRNARQGFENTGGATSIGVGGALVRVDEGRRFVPRAGPVTDDDFARLAQRQAATNTPPPTAGAVSAPLHAAAEVEEEEAEPLAVEEEVETIAAVEDPESEESDELTPAALPSSGSTLLAAYAQAPGAASPGAVEETPPSASTTTADAPRTSAAADPPKAAPAAPRVTPARTEVAAATPATRPRAPARSESVTPAVTQRVPVTKPSAPVTAPPVPAPKPPVPVTAPPVPAPKPPVPVTEEAAEKVVATEPEPVSTSTAIAPVTKPVKKKTTPVRKTASARKPTRKKAPAKATVSQPTPVAATQQQPVPASTPVATPAVAVATPAPAVAVPAPAAEPESSESGGMADGEIIMPTSTFGRLLAGGIAVLLPARVARSFGLLEMGGGRGFWWFTDVDSLVFDATLLAAIFFVVRRLRWGTLANPIFWFVVVLAAVSIPIAYTITNYGTLFRLRAMLFVVLALVPVAVTVGSDPDNTPPAADA